MKTIPFITELIPRGERWRLIGRHTAKTGISLVKLAVTFSGHWLRRMINNLDNTHDSLITFQ
jgi:hypothetical protein